MRDELTDDEKQLYYNGYSTGYSKGLSDAKSIGFDLGVKNERASLSKLLTALKERLFADNKSELFYPALADPRFAFTLAKIYLSDPIPEMRASELALDDRDPPEMRPRGDERRPAELDEREMDIYNLGYEQEEYRLLKLLNALRKRLAPEGKTELIDRAFVDPYLADALAEIYFPNEESYHRLPIIDAIDKQIAKLQQEDLSRPCPESLMLSLFKYDKETCAIGARRGRGSLLSSLLQTKLLEKNATPSDDECAESSDSTRKES